VATYLLRAKRWTQREEVWRRLEVVEEREKGEERRRRRKGEKWQGLQISKFTILELAREREGAQACDKGMRVCEATGLNAALWPCRSERYKGGGVFNSQGVSRGHGPPPLLHP
jgi:hypothetical protein